MVALNKIQLASQMFEEAHERYVSASPDIDYVVSIVLSGTVVGIVGPLLIEQGGNSSHSLLADISNAIAKPGTATIHEGVFRVVYNAFKHAGDNRRNILPSSDLEIRTDLKLEAARMLDAAINDFRQIEVLPEVKRTLTPQFVGLLESSEGYE